MKSEYQVPIGLTHAKALPESRGITVAALLDHDYSLLHLHYLSEVVGFKIRDRFKTKPRLDNLAHISEWPNRCLRSFWR